MCIILAKRLRGSLCLGKNRDRNYTPELVLRKEIFGDTEVSYLYDKLTGWSEGINEHGIGIVNSALMVQRDESEKQLVQVGKKSRDGERILKALSFDNLHTVLESLVHYAGGIKGHTFVADSMRLFSIETTSRHSSLVLARDPDANNVATNHGILHPTAGYTYGDDYISSRVRLAQAQQALKFVSNPEEMMPALHQKSYPDDSNYNMVRDAEKMKTSSQLVLDLNNRRVLIYLITGKMKFLGVENRLPPGYVSKISYEISEV